MKLTWCLLTVILCVEGVDVGTKGKSSGPQEIPVNHEVRTHYPEDYMSKRNATAEQATFRKFVTFRHKQRLTMIEELRGKPYSKQYRMLESVIPPVVEVVKEQRALLEGSGYIPGGEWPMNMTIRDSMTQVVESSLFLGEAFLRMPEVTRRVLKAKKEFEVIIGWAWTFASECLVYLDEKMHLPIIVMGQELGYTEKDVEFLKKYREEFEKPKPELNAQSEVERLLNEAKQHLKDKKKAERGPRMSAGDL